jgi:hypothetical protein
MTPYFTAWQANEAQGTLVVMILASLALVSVLGWLVIPVLMDQKFVTMCRWMYVAWVLLAAVILIVWRPL